MASVTELEQLVAFTDDAASACGLITDALSDYRRAGELPDVEAAEVRETARDEAWQGIDELADSSKRLAVLRSHLDDDA